ncbi:MAG: HAMP domain-containing protein, partial [Oscillospiraceae bacterium]
MKNLKVSKKLLLAFGLLIVMLVMLTSVASLGIKSMSGNLDIINSDMNGVNLVNSLNAKMEGITRNTLSAAIADNDADRNTYINKALTLNDELKQTVDGIAAMEGSEGLEPLLNSCRAVTDNMPTVADNIKSGNTSAAIELYNSTVAASVDECSLIVDSVYEQINAEVQTNYESSKSAANDVYAKVYIIGTIGEIICILLAVILTKYFTKAIKQVKETIVDISNGKLDSEIKIQSKDEFGQMAEAMRATTEKLSTIVRDASRMYG